MRYLVVEEELSIWRACSAIQLSRKAWYYESVKAPDDDVIEALNTYADKPPGYGFWKLYHVKDIRGTINVYIACTQN